MRPNERPFVLRERPLFAQQAVGQADPADVVEDARQADALDRLGRKAELAGGELGEAADTAAVRRAARVAYVEGLGEVHERGELDVRVAVARVRRAREDARHLGARDHRAVAAEALGRVQGLVGGAEKAVSRLAVEREGRYPEADREARVALARGERLLHHGPDPLG